MTLLRFTAIVLMATFFTPALAAVDITVNGSDAEPVGVANGIPATLEATITGCPSSNYYYEVWYYNTGNNCNQTGNTTIIKESGPITSCSSTNTTSHAFTSNGNYRVCYGYLDCNNSNQCTNPNLNNLTENAGLRISVGAGGGGLASFDISHDGSGLTCEPETITITALNNGGNVRTNYTGTATLTTSTNHGDWTLVSGSGSLSDTVADDGQASYIFHADDNGSVTLALRNTHDETLDITASSGTVNNTSAALTFRAYGYRVEPDPVGTRVSGMSFDITLTAVGNPPTDAGCSVIEEYTGSQTLKFWSEYVDPSTSPAGSQLSVNGTPIGIGEPASTSVSINFVDGVSDPVSLNYTDAGRIRFYARDDINVGDPPADSGSEIIVGGDNFVVRPFGFDIDFNNDRANNGTAGISYAADADGSVFTRAGVSFPATVRAVLWQAADDGNNDGIPDTGAWLADNNVTPNFGNESSPVVPADLSLTNTLVAPAGGDNGTLTVLNRDPAFNTASSNMDMIWDEVGITDITATYMNYLNSGQEITGTAINVGRFTPHHFVVNATEACDDTFTYSGQPFTVQVTAENLANAATQNYDGNFVKNPVISDPNPSSPVLGTFIPATNTFDSADFTTSDGIGTRNDVTYTFSDKETAPGLVDLRATDTDNVASDATTDGHVNIRSGRISMDNAYGSELVNLHVPMVAQYYDGNDFVINEADVCNNGVTVTLADPDGADTLEVGDGDTRGETCVQDTGNPGVSGVGCAIAAADTEIQYTDAPDAGMYTLYFKAPDSEDTFDPDNPIYGSLTVQANTPAYLKYDWDGDATEDKPAATISFGRYRGDDRVIYWREKF